MVSLPLLAPAGVQSIMGLSGTTYTPDSNGVITVNSTSGDLTSLLQSGCVLHTVLYQNLTSTNSPADTNENVLFTYSLAASWLSQGARGLKVRAWGGTAGNANNKTMKLYFGSAVVATPTAGTNNKGWNLNLEIHRAGLSSQVVHGGGLVDTTAVTPYNNAATETETSAIVIKLTAESGTGGAGDIVGKGFIVEAMW